MQAQTLEMRESRLSISDDGVALFEHLRGAQRNPLTMTLRADYVEMVTRLQGDARVRALVLQGSGGSFCAGGDVKAVQARLDVPAPAAPAATRQRILDLHGWLQRLRDLEVPVIAAIDGPAWGGGFAIALCADFVLATPRASFCMVLLRIGALPDMGAIHLLPRAIGLPRAKEMLMTGRRMEAGEAQRLGIVHSLHSPELLPADALQMARRFVAAPRVALGLTKRLTNRAYELDAAALAELEASAQAICLAEPEHAEAVTRFMRKRPARFDWERAGPAVPAPNSMAPLPQHPFDCRREQRDA